MGQRHRTSLRHDVRSNFGNLDRTSRHPSSHRKYRSLVGNARSQCHRLAAGNTELATADTAERTEAVQVDTAAGSTVGRMDSSVGTSALARNSSDRSTMTDANSVAAIQERKFHSGSTKSNCRLQLAGNNQLSGRRRILLPGSNQSTEKSAKSKPKSRARTVKATKGDGY